MFLNFLYKYFIEGAAQINLLHWCGSQFSATITNAMRNIFVHKAVAHFRVFPSS